MNKNTMSRRGFLKGMVKTTAAAVLANVIKFVPEAQGVMAKGGARANAFLQKPEDLVLKAIEGQEAAQVVSQILEDKDVRTLRRALSSFEPVMTEARVASAVWSNGAQQAIIVGVPFTNDHGAEAALLHVITNGVPETVMVEFLDKTDKTKAKIYTISGEQVNAVDASPRKLTLENATTTSAACTTDCLIQCLSLWGCSGLALTLCTVFILTCPFFIGSCVAAWTCTLYCGGAFSYCWCWCCGC